MRSRRIILIVVSTLTLLLCIIVGFKYINSKKEEPKTVQEVKVESKIEKYGYQLKDNDTSYFKELYKKLSTELSSEQINEEEYAKLLSQMFVTDFYTLSNKVTNSDIGGIDYVYKDYVSTFSSKAQNTVYKTVKSNVYGDRKQELPKVEKTTVESIIKESFKYNDKVDKEAYTVTLSIKYERDLQYPTSVKLVLIHNESKLEVAKMN